MMIKNWITVTLLNHIINDFSVVENCKIYCIFKDSVFLLSIFSMISCVAVMRIFFTCCKKTKKISSSFSQDLIIISYNWLNMNNFFFHYFCCSSILITSSWIFCLFLTEFFWLCVYEFLKYNNIIQLIISNIWARSHQIFNYSMSVFIFFDEVEYFTQICQYQKQIYLMLIFTASRC